MADRKPSTGTPLSIPLNRWIGRKTQKATREKPEGSDVALSDKGERGRGRADDGWVRGNTVHIGYWGR